MMAVREMLCRVVMNTKGNICISAAADGFLIFEKKKDRCGISESCKILIEAVNAGHAPLLVCLYTHFVLICSTDHSLFKTQEFNLTSQTKYAGCGASCDE